MKLSDVMGAANLAVYAELALVLFLAAFAAVLLWALWPGDGATWKRLGALPLEDERKSEVEEEGSSA